MERTIHFYKLLNRGISDMCEAEVSQGANQLNTYTVRTFCRQWVGHGQMKRFRYARSLEDALKLANAYIARKRKQGYVSVILCASCHGASYVDGLDCAECGGTGTIEEKEQGK